MTTITREQQKQILIDTANHVISRDNTSPYSENLRELARIALASLTAEPVLYAAEETLAYANMGEIHLTCLSEPMGDAVIPLYTYSPVSERERIRHEHAEWSDDDPVVFTDERNLRHIASGRETSLIWGKQNQEVGDIPLYRHAQPVPVDKEFIPKNLDKALGVVGVALPESKEEFNFQIERWIQLLIDRVIRYADEFKEQPAPVVPPEKWVNPDINYAEENGFAEGWNACRAAMLNGGKS
ncbi:Eaa protein [Salmonella enterica]|nr:Eaa protein [Salmonella enterica]